jgi:hypothetical protein
MLSVLLMVSSCGHEQDVEITTAGKSTNKVALYSAGTTFEVAPRELWVSGQDLDLRVQILDDRAVFFENGVRVGECVPEECGALTEQHYDTFVLASSLLLDPDVVSKAKQQCGPSVQLRQAMITGSEAYWCGVGTAGAAVIGGPATAFLYAIACGAWADMDSW